MRSIVASIIVGVSGAFAFISTLHVAETIEPYLFPVIEEWSPIVTVEGRDLVMTGTLRKVRPCVFLPPVRAKTATGVPLIVESSSNSANQTLIGDGDLHVFGPWRVRGSVGTKVIVYTEHQCHPMWDTHTVLGEVDAR